MKPEEEALKEIVIKICGKTSAIIVSMLKDKEHIDEFKIAQKADMTINELRNILYKLHHEDLVSFIRKKDKKKGWFIYYWTLSKEKAIRALIKDYQKELAENKSILDNLKKKNYFVCLKGHTELSEESAMEQNFECMECGELLVLKDKDVESKRLNKAISKIKDKIKSLTEIVDKYEKERLAKVQAELKRVERAKKRARKAKARAKKKAKKKIKKKIIRKKIKKKVKKRRARKPKKKLRKRKPVRKKKVRKARKVKVKRRPVREKKVKKVKRKVRRAKKAKKRRR